VLHVKMVVILLLVSVVSPVLSDNQAILKQTEDAINKASNMNKDNLERQKDWLFKQIQSTPSTIPRFNSLNHLPRPEFDLNRGDLLSKIKQAQQQIKILKSRQTSVYVFISFSLPKTMLDNLVIQARLAKAPLVLRGFYQESILKTRQKLQTLVKKGKPPPVTLIDPTLFERFNVTQVPAYVVTKGEALPCRVDGCKVPEFWGAKGEVPLDYALEQISDHLPEQQKYDILKHINKIRHPAS
jgi:type-F conjugative transfer system pilin assembly protein TrbC